MLEIPKKVAEVLEKLIYHRGLGENLQDQSFKKVREGVNRQDMFFKIAREEANHRGLSSKSFRLEVSL